MPSSKPVDAQMSWLEVLAALVLKDGVSLGGLSEDARAVALGLACCEVPLRVGLREADINVALTRALAQSCRFMLIDHVELRRWLVDAGWLMRDGFGREYRRVHAAALPAKMQDVAAALATIDPQAWVQGRRDASQQRREQRRQAWESSQGARPQ